MDLPFEQWKIVIEHAIDGFLPVRVGDVDRRIVLMDLRESSSGGFSPTPAHRLLGNMPLFITASQR